MAAKKSAGTDMIRYQIAIDLLKYEGQMIWKIMNVFMLVNAVYVGFVASGFDFEMAFAEFNPTYIIVGAIGLIVSFAWLGTFIRNSNSYDLRMGQAKLLEPKEYELLNGIGEKFANGGEVCFGSTPLQNRGIANYMKNRKAGGIIIYTFMVAYILLIISSFNFSC